MKTPRDAVLLRIFIGEDARLEHKPLYEVIVLKAREAKLAGATVLRGPMGFGHDSELHTAKILAIAENLPVLVEIVDTKEKIEAFVVELDGMIASGLVTMHDVKMIQYGKPTSG